MFENFDFKDGKVNFNYFWKVNLKSSLEEDVYSLSEDMLSLSYFDNKYIIDIGWYENGENFMISLIKDDNWDSPQKIEKIKSKEEIEEVLQIFIEAVYKNL